MMGSTTMTWDAKETECAYSYDFGLDIATRISDYTQIRSFVRDRTIMENASRPLNIGNTSLVFEVNADFVV